VTSPGSIGRDNIDKESDVELKGGRQIGYSFHSSLQIVLCIYLLRHPILEITSPPRTN
jgi:hypothetical protein